MSLLLSLQLLLLVIIAIADLNENFIAALFCHSDKVVHEDLQSEIKQLRNEKSSLQMALSESEIALADIRQELVTMKKKVGTVAIIAHDTPVYFMIFM